MLIARYTPDWNNDEEGVSALSTYELVIRNRSTLCFIYDLSDCEEDEINEICDKFKEYMEFIDDHSDLFFFPLKSYVQLEHPSGEKKPIFQIQTKYLPYKQTLRQYLTCEARNSVELEYQLINLIELYYSATSMNIPLHISMDDMSLVLMSSNELPFPKIYLSPFAYIWSHLLILSEEEVHIYSPFADIFIIFVIFSLFL